MRKRKITMETHSGLGFLEPLQIVFIVLKLIGTIQWSWWWVLAPTLIPLAVVMVACVIYLVIALVAKD